MLLEDQDRSRWDAALLTEGRAALERAARLRRPGRWQLHAAIAACHSDVADAASTDWLQVLTLYDMLLAYDRSPVVRLIVRPEIVASLIWLPIKNDGHDRRTSSCSSRSNP